MYIQYKQEDHLIKETLIRHLTLSSWHATNRTTLALPPLQLLCSYFHANRQIICSYVYDSSTMAVNGQGESEGGGCG